MNPENRLQAELLPHGALLRLQVHGVMLNLFPANAAEGGPANLWLRLQHADGGSDAVPLLGPLSPLRPLRPPGPQAAAGALWYAAGVWHDVEVQLQLRTAPQAGAWFWHVALRNGATVPRRVDLFHVQDLALAPASVVRLNEYYVSHYIDLAPLRHPRHGTMVAARQNQPMQGGRHPWLLIGALGHATAFATDALQVLGTALRTGGVPPMLRHGLPRRRLQHEHALAALQQRATTLAPGAGVAWGFFGMALADHPAASGPGDLRHAAAALALPEARPVPWPVAGQPLRWSAPSLFASATLLDAADLGEAELEALFPAPHRHAERDAQGALLSFFHGAAGGGGPDDPDSPGDPGDRDDDAAPHVVLRAKEALVTRPHGHLLRSGRHRVPDEASLTSTVWMAGVFHSMVTQGHVGMDCFVSTVRGALGQFRAHGQRVFVDDGSGWRLLAVPSAFEMRRDRCRWLYRHAGGLLEVCSGVEHAPHALTLEVNVIAGVPLKLCISHHLALGGDGGFDDGDGEAAAHVLRADRDGVFAGFPAGSEADERFPGGGFVVRPQPGSSFVGWDRGERLFGGVAAPGRPRWLAIEAEAAPRFALRIEGRLVEAEVASAPAAAAAREPALRLPVWRLPAASPLGGAAQRLVDIAPWFLHDALVHYLAPRGLEQFSGGGWGTRDVCQGPTEMLLALDAPAPVRDLLRRVFSAQNADGDWPQWFMFFERVRTVRAGDSHGDVVFWPLVALGRYLLASGDAALLDEPLPYFDAPAAPLWAHVERALALVAVRRIAGTELAAYGHGDWNDSLQPADPALREHLCSTWTVTLHHQMLTTLAAALESIHQAVRAAPLRAQADAVRADFQRLLVKGGVVAGYALFEPGRAPELLLHPTDTRTGLRYSLLPMMHAVIENMLPRDLAEQQAGLIAQHLVGPDGARLFDRPLPYRGGPMRLFQRAESSAFFGREIGVMYMHAHLRWAEMLAHLGQADAFFHALQLAQPIAVQALVAQASPRQANCYYSSSDAFFADRYEAERGYVAIARGEVQLDGGWRVYSSGPGIALGLIVTRLLGVRREHHSVVFDPVMPQALTGLVAKLPLGGREIELELRPGPQGHGPTALLLDGQPLPFTRQPHPYREGGAAVALPLLRDRLGAGARRLVVTTA